jgi:tetratricopeptide (TPR) repeat protein
MARKILTTTLILSLTAWLITWGHEQYVVQKAENLMDITDETLQKRYPEIAYTHAMAAYYKNDNESAVQYLEKAVAADSLYMDAWIRLAEIYAQMGQTQKATDILKFIHQKPMQVVHWNWSKMLLAWDLGEKDLFYQDANLLLVHPKMHQDTFQMLDMNLERDVPNIIEVLDSQHWTAYLKWLMLWGRVEDSFIAWEKVCESEEPNETLIKQYVNFLIKNKYVTAAHTIWKDHTGIDGVTNGGFEAEIYKKGFDWRYQHGKWRIERIGSPTNSGRFSLQIRFTGQENIEFSHLSQILAVQPGGRYKLKYSWKSKNITTDQGLYVEVYGFSCEGLKDKGPPMLQTHDWQDEAIYFKVPDECDAVVVRLRRKASKRFDSLISGTLWLDDFQLIGPEKLPH